MPTILPIDLENPIHTAAFLCLLNEYACHPMGGGQPLAAQVQAELIPQLRKMPTFYGFLAWEHGRAIGLVTCFQGFSTFTAKPLLNIHDIMVTAEYRSQGIAHALLQSVEIFAKTMGCCKLTLEVLQGNVTAQNSYQRFGFRGYSLDPEMGNALFWEKKLL